LFLNPVVKKQTPRKGAQPERQNKMNTTTTPTSAKVPPTHQILIGSIKAAIWKNTTEKGDQFNVTVSRIYKDGEVWKSTNSFGKDDLLALAKVADKAHDWVCEQK
jgi:hypothetical protein